MSFIRLDTYGYFVRYAAMPCSPNPIRFLSFSINFQSCQSILSTTISLISSIEMDITFSSVVITKMKNITVTDNRNINVAKSNVFKALNILILKSENMNKKFVHLKCNEKNQIERVTLPDVTKCQHFSILLRLSDRIHNLILNRIFVLTWNHFISIISPETK